MSLPVFCYIFVLWLMHNNFSFSFIKPLIKVMLTTYKRGWECVLNSNQAPRFSTSETNGLHKYIHTHNIECFHLRQVMVSLPGHIADTRV